MEFIFVVGHYIIIIVALLVASFVCKSFGLTGRVHFFIYLFLGTFIVVLIRIAIGIATDSL